MMESRGMQIDRETRYLRSFQREADQIARLIVTTDLPWVDIAIRIARLRREAERLFAPKMDLYDMIYTSRFHRLWRQWRGQISEGMPD